MPTIDCLRLSLMEAGVVRCPFDPWAEPHTVAFAIPNKLGDTLWDTLADRFFLPAISELVMFAVTQYFCEVHKMGLSIDRHKRYYHITLSVSRGQI